MVVPALDPDRHPNANGFASNQGDWNVAALVTEPRRDGYVDKAKLGKQHSARLQTCQTSPEQR